MGRNIISATSPHGFHAAAVIKDNFGIDESHYITQKARLAGIDIEYMLYGESRVPDPKMHYRFGGTVKMLEAELEAIEVARKTPWQDLRGDQRFRVRAIVAEKHLKEAQQDLEVLKDRLRSGDNGTGAWIDEREALLTQIQAHLAAETDLSKERARAEQAEKDFEDLQDLSNARYYENNELKESKRHLEERAQGLMETLTRVEKELLDARQQREEWRATANNLTNQLVGGQHEKAELDAQVTYLKEQLKLAHESHSRTLMTQPVLDVNGVPVYEREIAQLRADLQDANRALQEARERVEAARVFVSTGEVEFLRALVMKMVEK